MTGTKAVHISEDVEELFNKVVPEDVKLMFREIRVAEKFRQSQESKKYYDAHKDKIKRYKKEKYMKLKKVKNGRE